MRWGGFKEGDHVRVWITGGSGFIGRNLVESLGDEFELLAPGHSALDLMDEDAVKRFMRREQMDVIIHCATKPGHRNAVDPTGLLYENTRMFNNIVRNEGFFGRMVLLTSGAVYDQRYYLPKMAESYFDEHVPVDDTGYSKYLCARIASKLEGVVELRPFGVFGKYEDWEIRFISNAICKTLFDLPVTIRQNRKIDYLWIEDLVNLVRHFLRRGELAGAYNLTPDAALELKYLARMVIDESGKDLPVIIAKEGLGVEYSGDNSKLREALPDFKFTPITETVRKLYGWYSDNRHLIRRDLLLYDK